MSLADYRGGGGLERFHCLVLCLTKQSIVFTVTRFRFQRYLQRSPMCALHNKVHVCMSKGDA